MNRTKGLTQAKVRQELKAIGIVFKLDMKYGEFVVSFPGNKDSEYFTGDLEDALNTGKAMAMWKEGNDK